MFRYALKRRWRLEMQERLYVNKLRSFKNIFSSSEAMAMAPLKGILYIRHCWIADFCNIIQSVTDGPHRALG